MTPTGTVHTQLHGRFGGEYPTNSRSNHQHSKLKKARTEGFLAVLTHALAHGVSATLVLGTHVLSALCRPSQRLPEMPLLRLEAAAYSELQCCYWGYEVL